MTVSYKKAGAQGGNYYIDCTTGKRTKREVDDYYTAGEKEPPGVWYVGSYADGSRETTLGIVDGEAFTKEDHSNERFTKLIKGFNPVTGIELVQNTKAKNRIALHDFTLSPPKSVSVVWSQANKTTKANIEKSLTKSGRIFLDFMSKRSVGREGAKGSIKTAAPLIGAMFEHGSSRENDPQHHIHCVLFNACERPDGSHGAIDTKEIMRWQGAAASLYHASIAYEMAQQSFKIRKEGKLFEIDGVPDHVKQFFSKRREQIEAYAFEIDGVPDHVKQFFSKRREQIEAYAEKEMKKLGLEGDAATAARGLLQKATTETRNAKNELTRKELQALWDKAGKELGFTQKEVDEIMDAPEFVELSEEELLNEARVAIDELTEQHAVFKEPALVTAVAVKLTGKASPEAILRTVENIKKELVSTTEDKKSATRVRSEQSEEESKKTILTDDVIYSTRQMVVLEREMLEAAVRKDGQHILKDVDFPPGLSPEQREAAIAATTDINAVTVIEGTAGAGKTFTMASIARAYESNGYTVTGLSGSWSAALNLQKEAQLAEGRAIQGWVNDVKSGRVKINSKSLIVIDEAGMVGTKQMHSVLKLAEEYDAKVIPLGDTKQQKSMGAGDPLRNISEVTGSKRLNIIRRQNRETEREAVLKFFDGKGKEAMAVFEERGNVRLNTGEDATHKQLIEDWQKSRSRTVGDVVQFSRDGEELTGTIDKVNGDKWLVKTDADRSFEVLNSHLILAIDTDSTAALNKAAHEARREAGELGKSASFNSLEAGSKDQPIEFSVGDEVVIRKTQKEEDVFNRNRGVIEDIDDDVVSVRTTEGKLVKMDSKDPAWGFSKEDPRFALQHAYATTSNSSQGLTVGHVYVKDHLAFARDSAGVVMSRHREDCHVYVDKQARYTQKMNNTKADEWKHINEYSDRECMDQVAKSWSKKRVKDSTLDFEGWKKEGAEFPIEIEMQVQKSEAAAKVAKEEIERIRQSSKTSVAPVRELKFQKSEQYRVETPNVGRDALRTGLQKLDDSHFDNDVVERAIRQDVLRFDPKGEAVYCGRRPGDNAVVSTFGGENPQNDGLRGRYPPILRGDPESNRVDVVRTGRDALKLWNTQSRQGQPLSTVVVSNGREDVMRMPHVRALTDEAEVIEHHDQPENTKIDKAFEAAQEKQRAAVALAAEQERARQRASPGLTR